MHGMRSDDARTRRYPGNFARQQRFIVERFLHHPVQGNLRFLSWTAVNAASKDQSMSMTKVVRKPAPSRAEPSWAILTLPMLTNIWPLNAASRTSLRCEIRDPHEPPIHAPIFLPTASREGTESRCRKICRNNLEKARVRKNEPLGWPMIQLTR